MRGSYTYTIDRKGNQHIPFFRRSRLTPDQLEIAYLRGHGEFSAESDMAFDRHINEIRANRLRNIAQAFFNRRKNLPNLRIVNY